ncbi:MAG TPA: Fe-S cluster assembly protein SufD [Thermoanaerobaculales bacterium]|nr:Fe-S cluster assembly protein SufD [Thermoanaerobaculales bacterium]
MSAATVPTHPLLAGVDALLDGRLREPGFLAERRRQAAASFARLGLPTRRWEEWRFTGVKHLGEAPWVVAERARQLPPMPRPSLADGLRLAVVDGWLEPELSRLDGLPDGVFAGSLAEAAARRPELVEPHLARHDALTDHPFVALSTAQFRDGVLLWVPAGTVLDRPIEVELIARPHDRPTIVLPRFLIVVGRSSQATVILRSSGGSADTFTCAVTEVVLEDGAVLDHCSVIDDDRGVTHIASLEARQGRDSALRSGAFTLGGGLVRNDLAVTLRGEGADATLDGLYLTSGGQHVDNHLRVRHGAPGGTSRQLYKGILDGSSRAVFNGRIVVDTCAQKTDARQSNRNLLLSAEALVQSNPQLEILADDVRCTHGSTIGRLDEDAVFYLRSRGLDRGAAESMLTWAFAAEVVDRVRVPELRDSLRDAMLARLPGPAPFAEAM